MEKLFDQKMQQGGCAQEPWIESGRVSRGGLESRMRSPDLRRAKQIDKICVYEQTRSKGNRVGKGQEPKPGIRRVLRRNKRKLHIRHAPQEEPERGGQEAGQGQESGKNPLNIYSNQYRPKRVITGLGSSKKKRSPVTKKNSNSLEKEVKRHSEFANIKGQRTFGRMQYMSVDKHRRHGRSLHPQERGQMELDKQKKRDFVKKFLKGEVRAMGNPVSFTSPNLVQKPLRSSDPKKVVRSKTKEDKMKSSGNSFFKYSISKLKKTLKNQDQPFR